MIHLTYYHLRGQCDEHQYQKNVYKEPTGLDWMKLEIVRVHVP